MKNAEGVRAFGPDMPGNGIRARPAMA